MTDPPLIELQDVSCRDSRNGRMLLDQVSCSLRAGDRLGLIGPSGSGKTTLLRTIVKLDPGIEGEILFRGQPIAVDQVPAYRRQVIYLAQRPAFGDVTVRENLEMPFSFATAYQSQSVDWDRVTTWLDRLDRPQALLNQQVNTLSGGERQMIALMRSMLLSPQVLLLDEPTAAIDDETAGQFEQLVIDWYQATPGRALIWTSHDHDQVGRMTTQQIELIAGKMQ